VGIIFCFGVAPGKPGEKTFFITRHFFFPGGRGDFGGGLALFRKRFPSFGGFIHQPRGKKRGWAERPPQGATNTHRKKAPKKRVKKKTLSLPQKLFPSFNFLIGSAFFRWRGPWIGWFFVGTTLGGKTKKQLIIFAHPGALNGKIRGGSRSGAGFPLRGGCY